MKMFSQRILAACGHVRNKRKNVHSGKKTNPAVLRIIRLLPEGSPKQASSSSLGSSSQPSLPLVDLGKQSAATGICDGPEHIQEFVQRFLWHSGFP